MGGNLVEKTANARGVIADESGEFLGAFNNALLNMTAEQRATLQAHLGVDAIQERVAVLEGVSGGGTPTPTPGPTPSPGPTPTSIPAAIPLGDWSQRSLLHNPPASVTAVPSSDNPYGQSSVIQIDAGAAATVSIANSAVMSPPVDVRNGAIHMPFKPVFRGHEFSVSSVKLYSSGSKAAPPANYHQLDRFGEGPSSMQAVVTSNGDAPGRWQVWGFPVGSALKQVGTGADLSAITWIEWELRAGASGGKLELGKRPLFQPNALTKAKAIFCFDDLHDTVFTTVRPLFNALGWKFSFNGGALNTTIGQPGRMTLAQCQQLVAEGHHMMLQAWSSEAQATIDAMTDAQRAAEMQAQIDFMVANGLMQPGDKRFGSYFSSVGDKDMTAFPMFRDYNTSGTRKHMQARSQNPPFYYGETFPWPDKHSIRAIAGEFTSPSDNRAVLYANAIADKGVAITNRHNDLTTLSADLDLLDGLRSQIDVVSAKQLLDAFV
jgi:hypothetical protein